MANSFIFVLNRINGFIAILKNHGKDQAKPEIYPFILFSFLFVFGAVFIDGPFFIEVGIFIYINNGGF